MHYELSQSAYDNTRWTVELPPVKPGETEWWDVWAFCRCEEYCGDTPIVARQFKRDKQRTAFTSCEFNCYVVSRSLGEAMCRIAPDAIQLVPVQIGDEPRGEWYILNILDRVDCIDFDRSEVTWEDMQWEGKIKSVSHLEIDPEKVAGHHIFRLDRYSIKVLVSGTMANAMLKDGFDGFVLTPLPWNHWKHDEFHRRHEQARRSRL